MGQTISTVATRWHVHHSDGHWVKVILCVRGHPAVALARLPCNLCTLNCWGRRLSKQCSWQLTHPTSAIVAFIIFFADPVFFIHIVFFFLYILSQLLRFQCNQTHKHQLPRHNQVKQCIVLSLGERRSEPWTGCQSVTDRLTTFFPYIILIVLIFLFLCLLFVILSSYPVIWTVTTFASFLHPCQHTPSVSLVTLSVRECLSQLSSVWSTVLLLILLVNPWTLPLGSLWAEILMANWLTHTETARATGEFSFYMLTYPATLKSHPWPAWHTWSITTRSCSSEMKRLKRLVIILCHHKRAFVICFLYKNGGRLLGKNHPEPFFSICINSMS